jgi:hypothetical protein
MRRARPAQRERWAYKDSIMDVGLEYGLVTLGLVFALAGISLLAAAFIRRSKKFAIFAISFLAISAVLVGRLGYAEFWEIDTCLDAGGIYDYEASTCRYD